ncbi:MAG: PAS domain-containing protein [Syntrophaceae bacterium]|nr:PAS domain-containing protein [Syntrophaceae bacterium]
MNQDPIIYRNILENMTDGVMTVSLDGRIMTFNEAAERILDLRAEDVLGRSMSEVFLGREGNDAFNQAILDAVYDEAVTQNGIVLYTAGEKRIVLSVTTSFLGSDETGQKKKAAVIAVFSDRTEVEALRETEHDLTEEIKAKHRELQTSYSELEESNTSLKAALKKVQMIRIAATALVLLLFLSIGILTWIKGTPGRSGQSSTTDSQAGAVKTYKVALQPLVDKISLRGTLKPIQVVNVTSPFAGTVTEKLFEYGQSVTRGQLLMRLDTREIESKCREAKSAFIKANEKRKEMKDWKNTDEMVKAMRSLDKAKRSYEETETLFKKGIVSADEYNNEKNNYENELLTYKTTKAKGEGDNVTLAKLDYYNARAKLADLENQLGKANVLAPVSGTVILMDTVGDKDRKGKAVEKGTSFGEGEIMLAVGDTTGLSVSTEVDEIEVTKIKKGQQAIITGDAFPDVTLKGSVDHISSQANVKGGEGGAKKAATFEILIRVDRLLPEVADKIRLGMSANLSIEILNKPDGILVPIGAVQTDGADRYVMLKEAGKREAKRVNVKTGITTLDSVEILQGLKIGDEVLVREEAVRNVHAEDSEHP